MQHDSSDKLGLDPSQYSDLFLLHLKRVLLNLPDVFYENRVLWTLKRNPAFTEGAVKTSEKNAQLATSYPLYAFTVDKEFDDVGIFSLMIEMNDPKDYETIDAMVDEFAVITPKSGSVEAVYETSANTNKLARLL